MAKKGDFLISEINRRFILSNILSIRERMVSFDIEICFILNISSLPRLVWHRSANMVLPMLPRSYVPSYSSRRQLCMALTQLQLFFLFKVPVSSNLARFKLASWSLKNVRALSLNCGWLFSRRCFNWNGFMVSWSHCRKFSRHTLRYLLSILDQKGKPKV